MIYSQSIPYQEPEQLFDLVQDKPWAIFLDSALQDNSRGRFSYIGFEPFLRLSLKDGQMLCNDRPVACESNPFSYLKQQLSAYQAEYQAGLPPFQGGAAGVFSYDLNQYLEAVPTKAEDLLRFPDLAIGFYDLVLAFDTVQQQAWVVSTGFPEQAPEARALRAKARLQSLLDLMASPTEQTAPLDYSAAKPSCLQDKAQYLAALQQVQDYILAGDIFQANLAQVFTAELPLGLSPWQLYRRLRSFNPAPFAAFMHLGEHSILSASPERFLKLQQGAVEARPIKGTRPRGDTLESDQALALQLQQSEKDRSENIMIVDLLRNDLSKCCEADSVAVSQLCGLESFATVHHLVSVIEGRLQDGFHALDLLASAFPGGSITGAPKIRAMQIIAELEPYKRGPYCGSIAYIAFNGEMDSSILIRSFILRDRQLYFQAGGAVVLDSNPEAEYQETWTKVAGLCAALGREDDDPRSG